MRIRRSVQLAAATDDVRRALTAAETFLRCLPGAALDSARADTGEGRFLVRIDGHQITYRGSATCTDGENIIWKATAAQVRGEGEVHAALTFTTHDDPGGSTLAVDARLSGSGRVAEFDLDARRTAAERLLERLLQGLAQEVARAAAGPEQSAEHPADAARTDRPTPDDRVAVPRPEPLRAVRSAAPGPDTTVVLPVTRPPVPLIAAVLGSLGVLLFWVLRRMNIRH